MTDKQMTFWNQCALSAVRSSVHRVHLVVARCTTACLSFQESFQSLVPFLFVWRSRAIWIRFVSLEYFSHFLQVGCFCLPSCHPYGPSGLAQWTVFFARYSQPCQIFFGPKTQHVHRHSLSAMPQSSAIRARTSWNLSVSTPALVSLLWKGSSDCPLQE